MLKKAEKVLVRELDCKGLGRVSLLVCRRLGEKDS